MVIGKPLDTIGKFFGRIAFFYICYDKVGKFMCIYIFYRQIIYYMVKIAYTVHMTININITVFGAIDECYLINGNTTNRRNTFYG